MKSLYLKEEKPEWRTELKKYYKKIKVCSNCGKQYGFDQKMENKYRICPKCSTCKRK